MIYSRFPEDKPITQGLIRDHGLGAVVAANLLKIYGINDGSYGSTPDFSTLDRQLEQANGLPIHLHPVICRSGRGRPVDLLLGRVEALGRPVIERYAPTITRVTLAQELTLCRQDLWDEIVLFCKAVAADFPQIELWIGDYQVRNQMDRDGILTRLEDLTGVVTGFVNADYTDLSLADNPATQFMKINAIGQIPLMRFNYLLPFWRQIRRLGIEKIALETSVLSDADSPAIRKAQIAVYERLHLLCEHEAAELWLWHLCGECGSVFGTERQSDGVWDAQGNRRLDLAFL